MKAWKDFLLKLEKQLGKETVSKWLRPLKILKFDARNLYIEAHNSFQILWFQEHIKMPLVNSNHKLIKIHFYLQGKPFKPQKKQKTPLVQKEHFSPDYLTSHAKFDNFFPDTTPHLALEILSNLSDKPFYNPIFVQGLKGSGKTHLLMATADKLSKEGKKVFFVSSQTFTEHVIRAYRTGNLKEFRGSYRDIDCLIIDDIHLLKQRTTTQEELFHTFNRLHSHGILILLSGRCFPHLLEGIEERLKSRFEWGITLSLKAATPEILRKILEKRAADLSCPLNEETLHFLLKTFPNSSSLIRALEALVLRTYQSKKNLNLKNATLLLKDLISKEKNQLKPETILEQISLHFYIKKADLLGKSQRKEHVFPRKIAMYLYRTELHMSYVKIGKLFSRDHSTVISSIKFIEKERNNKNPEVLSALLALQQSLIS